MHFLTSVWAVKKQMGILVPLNDLCQDILTIALMKVSLLTENTVSDLNPSSKMRGGKTLWPPLHLIKTDKSFSSQKISCHNRPMEYESPGSKCCWENTSAQRGRAHPRSVWFQIPWPVGHATPAKTCSHQRSFAIALWWERGQRGIGVTGGRR